MKLLLINPPETKMIRADNPEFIDEERGANPNLGILYIAAVARQQKGWEVEVIDGVGEGLSYEALRPRIRSAEADLIGITVLTFTVFDVIETLKICYEESPDSQIIMGGPHAHIYPEETLGWKGVDIVATGEGEAIIPNLLAVFPDRKALKSIRGLAFRDRNGNVINTGIPDLITDLEKLPFPARDLTDIKLYSSVVSRHNPISTMITSRGCPFKCRYCDRPHLGKRFRAHSAEYVVREMQECTALGIGEVFIYDDTFTVNRKRILDICNRKIEKGIKLAFDIRARVDQIDLEMLEALKAAGCERIHYGVEAGTDKIQKILGKGITLAQAKNAVKMTKKVGIKCLAYFMIGSPTETREDIRESIRFASELDPDFVSITILTPFPETDFYFKALEEGVIDHDYFKAFAKNPKEDFKVKYWEKDLSRDVLFEELERAYRKFYGRPRYILRELFAVRSINELKKKVKMGLKVLGIKRR
ncbi:B12-binding domain-containing radical SAM protein [Thermodesulfobacteriota bacterium]